MHGQSLEMGNGSPSNSKVMPEEGRKLQTYQKDSKPTFCLLPISWTVIVIIMTTTGE